MPQGLRASRLWLALVLACFCLPLFVGLGRADIEGDEAIYSFGVDRILEIGDWLAPRSSPHEDAVFLEKPPLKFWIVAAPMKLGVLPHNEFGMRAWDALFGAAAFVYVFLIGCRLAGALCGATAVMGLFVHAPLLFAHGLRTNNMEAALFLSYCAGFYHYLRWHEAATPAEGRRHAMLAGVAFVLGFLTKFVAAAFLPLVMGVTGLIAGDVRRRLWRDWRLWGGVILLILALSAPWFIYAQLRFGMLLWETILKEHVYNRFTSFLDPAHVQPWHFYVTEMITRLRESGMLEVTVIGLLWMLVDLVRRRTFAVGLVLAWLVLPMFLISLGTSKLYHYAYPFVPPAALAAGYVVANGYTLLQLACNTVLRRIDRTWIRTRAGLVQVLERPAVRTAVMALASLALAIAAVSLVLGVFKVELGGRTLFRSAGVLRPAVVAFICGLLAASFKTTSRGVAAVMVASLLPFPAYRWTMTQLTLDQHPMRLASDCLQRLAQTQPGLAGRGLYVDVPGEVMTHGMNYYFRRVQPWTRAEQSSPGTLAGLLSDTAAPRPMLVYDRPYQAFMRGADAGVRQRTVSPPLVSFPDVVLLLPGPWAECSGITGTKGVRAR